MKMAQEMKDAGLDPASAGGAPSADMMSKMAEKMKDPAMQEAMADMMKNISPEQLKEMSAASGMQMSDEQAQQTAKMMQSISPETMRRMMTAGTYLQGVFSRARAVYQWVTRNKMFAASVAVLGVATFVSYLMRWGVFAVESAEPAEAGAARAAKGEEEDPWAQEREF
jgi:preprotein translocase subunit SecE